MKPSCPHCGSELLKWRTPERSTWDAPFLYVCFSDTCPYYQRGWTWLEQQFGRRASYRHCLDPSTGVTAPLPVWSPEALKSDIIAETEEPSGHHGTGTERV